MSPQVSRMLISVMRHDKRNHQRRYEYQRGN